MGSRMYEIESVSPVNLSYVNLIITPKNLEERKGKVLPHTHFIGILLFTQVMGLISGTSFRAIRNLKTWYT